MPHYDADITPDVVNVPLTGWTPFAESADAIRALIFGQMVLRAIPVVREYQSDLYHIAQWLAENVTGPCEFDWLARPSGTNIGDVATIQVKIGAGDTAQFYRVRVYAARSPLADDAQPVERESDSYWHVRFTRVSLDEVRAR